MHNMWSKNMCGPTTKSQIVSAWFHHNMYDEHIQCAGRMSSTELPPTHQYQHVHFCSCPREGPRMATQRTAAHGPLALLWESGSTFPSHSKQSDKINAAGRGPGVAPKLVASLPSSSLSKFPFTKPVEIQYSLIYRHRSHKELHPDGHSGVLGKFEPYIHDPFKIISTLRKKATKKSHRVVGSFLRLWQILSWTFSDKECIVGEKGCTPILTHQVNLTPKSVL